MVQYVINNSIFSIKKLTISRRDLFEYVAKFEDKRKETTTNGDGQSSLAKVVLSGQWTVQFSNEVTGVDTVPDTNVALWPPMDEWMRNIDNIEFWKSKETEWGKGLKNRAMASDLFKAMLSAHAIMFQFGEQVSDFHTGKADIETDNRSIFTINALLLTLLNNRKGLENWPTGVQLPNEVLPSSMTQKEAKLLLL